MTSCDHGAILLMILSQRTFPLPIWYSIGPSLSSSKLATEPWWLNWIYRMPTGISWFAQRTGSSLAPPRQCTSMVNWQLAILSTFPPVWRSQCTRSISLPCWPLIFITHDQGVDPVWNYMDDFFACNSTTSPCAQNLDIMTQTCVDLGLPLTHLNSMHFHMSSRWSSQQAPLSIAPHTSHSSKQTGHPLVVYLPSSVEWRVTLLRWFLVHQPILLPVHWHLRTLLWGVF